MYPPPNWAESRPGEVWKLKKSVYGLKQAGFNWYRCLSKALKRLGFRKSKVDDCIFIKNIGESRVVTAFHVDDLLFTGDSDDLTLDAIKQLGNDFELNCEVANWILGMALEQSEDGITLDVSQYCKQILERFEMNGCKAASTPFPANTALIDNTSSFSTDQPYMEIVGSIMYAATAARPDLAYAASELGRFMKKPSDEHYTAAKHVLRYLKGTLKRKIKYRRHNNAIVLKCFVDADYAGDKNTRKSRTGYVILIGDSVVDWRSTKQTCTSTSTYTAEVVALSDLAKVIIPMIDLLEELGCPQTEAVEVMEDNHAAHLFASQGTGLRKVKHLHIRYRYIREVVEDGLIAVNECDSADNIADVFTKAVTPEVFRRCIMKIMSDNE